MTNPVRFEDISRGKPRLAAIDIGTNSFHLIIVEVDTSTGKFNTLGREKEIVRLGSGSTDMKLLHEDAVARAIDTLKKYKGLADSAGAEVRAIATSAVREAINQNEFIKKVKEETGIKIETASGVEEARYIYLGVLQALPVFNKRILLIDIGGGSTEFLIGYQREIAYDNSLKLGAIRLTQRFFKDKETNSKSAKACRQFIQGYMSPITRECARYKFDTAVGSSGTIMNLANIINVKQGGSPAARLNNFTFTKDELYEAVETILDAKNEKQRLKIQGLDPDRADIITAGALIVEQIFKELKIKEMVVSEYALREGIVLDTIEKKYMLKSKEHLSDLRYKSVMHIAENFRIEKEHAMHVTGLALKIFDQTKKLHTLGSTEKEYLEAAAILHEVGSFVSHSQHHRHSYYLIRNSEMLGFTEGEKEIIANIARYHRKSHPKAKHLDFAKLSTEDQLIIRKLAAILRVADGLDRSHTSSVKNIETKYDNNTVTFKLSGGDGKNLELDIWGAQSKSSLFEETFECNVKFEPVR
ncbi:MAG: Ppx/GppA family phosphatase [Chlorobi bacterium]|nr:Ppx/GppA family phosphatase [Chlorobiota bacterium]MCI0716104.1 Ppx/GppA family phosphatase [Chlorobiota bacterium]